LALLVVPAQSITAEGGTILCGALRSGGHVALLRHAIAPGTGDPPEFAIGDLLPRETFLMRDATKHPGSVRAFETTALREPRFIQASGAAASKLRGCSASVT
jgi:hypothetical protein